jgi:hypothetical protein
MSSLDLERDENNHEHISEDDSGMNNLELSSPDDNG